VKFSFLTVLARFLERILMEHIQSKDSLEVKLQTDFICSIRIVSRKCDIFEKPRASFISKPSYGRQQNLLKKIRAFLYTICCITYTLIKTHTYISEEPSLGDSLRVKLTIGLRNS